MSDVYSVLVTVAALFLTVIVFQAAVELQRRLDSPVANPLLVAVVFLIVLLLITGFPYAAYAKATQGLSFLLGPATVALAVPLCRQLEQLKRNWQAILGGILAGTVTGVGSVLLFSLLFSAPGEIILSLVPKSVTTPIAMDVAHTIGGIPPLTAVLVILTGMLGAVLGPEILNHLRVNDETARGLAIGASAHALGTSRAIKESERQGAVSGLAIGLVGFVTAMIAPFVVKLAGY